MNEDPTVGRWPRRRVLVALCFLACLVAYTDRVNISVAAVAMKEQLGWSQTEKGFVLSSFFIGYMLFMYASGWLAKRYGGRNVLGIAVIAWSVFTLLTPPAAAMSIPLLIGVRICMGLGEAAVFPASVELYSRWVPAAERTRAMARLLSGIPVGTVVGLMATGWIVGQYHWSMAFYSFGVLGLAWAALWFASVSNDPARDPGITPSELALIENMLEAQRHPSRPPGPQGDSPPLYQEGLSPGEVPRSEEGTRTILIIVIAAVAAYFLFFR